MNQIWLGIVVFFGGAAAGALLTYALRHRFDDAQALRRKLDELTREAEAFRVEVDEHFSKTSDLFEEVTEKYRDLYDHLAEGATGLSRNTQTRLSVELPERMLPDQGAEQQPPQDDQTVVADVDESLLPAADEEQAVVHPQVPRDHAKPDRQHAGGLTDEHAIAEVATESADNEEELQRSNA